MYITEHSNIFASKHSKSFYSDSDEPVYELKKWYSAGYFPGGRVEYQEDFSPIPGFHGYCNLNVLERRYANGSLYGNSLILLKAEFKNVISFGTYHNTLCLRACNRRLIDVVHI